MQELAQGIKQLLDNVSHQMLTAGKASGLPLTDCVPLLADMARAWTAYSSNQTAGAVSNAAPDAGMAVTTNVSLF